MSGPRSLSEDEIIDIANQEGLPGNELLALADKEDSYDNSTSGSGARGRFQLLPATFKSVYPEGDINNPRDNAIAAARYYGQNREKFGTPEDAAAAYYAGPAWQRKVEKAPGAKYGTNPDGSGGISIEDYRSKFSQKLAGYRGEDQPPTTVAHVADSTGVSGDLNDSIAAVSYDLQNQARGVITASKNLQESLRKNTEEQMKGLDQQGELEAKIGLDKYAVAARRDAIDSAEQTRLGINPDDIDNTIAQISVGLNARYEEAFRMRQQIHEEQSVGFFDDPLRYIGNMFTLPNEIRQHNAIIQEMDAMKSYVDQASGIASTVHNMQAAKFTSVSLDGAQAAAELSRAKAHYSALQLQDQKLKTDFTTQVTTLNALRVLQQEQENAELRKENLKIRQTKEETLLSEQERVKMDNQSVQVAAQMLGMKIPDRKTLDKQPKAIKESIERIMDSGKFGVEPLDAFQVLQTGDPNKMAAVTQQQYRTLQTAFNAAMVASKSDPLFDAKKPQEKRDFIAQRMREEFAKSKTDPNYTGLKSNPYQIPGVASMANVPEVANSRIVALAAQFRKDFPTRDLTDSQLYSLVQANIGPTKAYNNSVDAATDIAKYYQAGIKLNNEKVGFESFGMPKQDDYKVRLQGGLTDMSSYSEVHAHILKTQRNRQLLDFVEPAQIQALEAAGKITKEAASMAVKNVKDYLGGKE